MSYSIIIDETVATVRNDIRMPTDEEAELLDFYLPTCNSSQNIKRLISPYRDDAFTQEVLHAVVNERLGFSVPYDIWNSIDDAFSCYWNDEAGLYGYISEEAMFLSIRRQLIDDHILLHDRCLGEIVAAIIDFIVQIPGVVIQ